MRDRPFIAFYFDLSLVCLLLCDSCRPAPKVVEGVREELARLKQPYVGVHVRAGYNLRNEGSFKHKEEIYRSCLWSWFWCARRFGAFGDLTTAERR